MEMGNMIKVIIAAVMMIVVVTVVVIPVLQDASYDQLGNNTPSQYAAELPDEAVIAKSANGYTLNGTEIEAAVNDTIVISDTFTITVISNGLQIKDTTTVANSGATGGNVTISGTAYTYGTGENTKTGTISGTAYYIGADSGPMGVYDGEFIIDKTDTIETYVILTTRDSSNNALVLRGTVKGTANDLEFVGLITGSADAATGTSTVVLNSNSYTEPNAKNYTIASGNALYITYTVSDTTYTGTTNQTLEWIGPLEYTQITDTGGAIESMINLTPLLMIVGVIVMVVAAAVLRR